VAWHSCFLCVYFVPPGYLRLGRLCVRAQSTHTFSRLAKIIFGLCEVAVFLLTPWTLDEYDGIAPLPKSMQRFGLQCNHFTLFYAGVKEFFYCCVCILCHGNVFTKPLPSNDRGIHRHIGSKVLSKPYLFLKIGKVG
jgi:hypothetical protein